MTPSRNQPISPVNTSHTSQQVWAPIPKLRDIGAYLMRNVMCSPFSFFPSSPKDCVWGKLSAFAVDSGSWFLSCRMQEAVEIGGRACARGKDIRALRAVNGIRTKPGPYVAGIMMHQNYLQDWLKRRQFYIPRIETWGTERNYHFT